MMSKRLTKWAIRQARQAPPMRSQDPEPFWRSLLWAILSWSLIAGVVFGAAYYLWRDVPRVRYPGPGPGIGQAHSCALCEDDSWCGERGQCIGGCCTRRGDLAYARRR